MFTIQEFYSTPLTVKLSIARQLYQKQASILMTDPSMQEGLTTMRERESHLRNHMQSMAMHVHCIACADKEGGGCCSEYMSNENDVVQLLLNLLAGVIVEIQRDDGFECPLLGPSGCILKFKPMFCLNYNCRQIVHSVSSSEMESLHRLTGDLLQEQYRLEQLVLDILQRKAVISR